MNQIAIQINCEENMNDKVRFVKETVKKQRSKILKNLTHLGYLQA